MENEKRLCDVYRLVIDLAKANKYGRLEYDDVLAVIASQKTVDAVEVVHGRWISIIDEPTPLRKMPMLSGYKCSVCGRYEKEEEPYCNCGAKMDGDGDG